MTAAIPHKTPEQRAALRAKRVVRRFPLDPMPRRRSQSRRGGAGATSGR